MRNLTVLVLTLTCILALGAAPSLAGERFRWWLDGRVQGELQLTPSQAQRLDDIFKSTLADRRRLRAGVEQAQLELDRAITAGDETLSAILISRVTSAQAAHGRARTLMVWRMYRVLTPEQRRRLQQIEASHSGHAQAVRTSSPGGVSTPR